MEEKIIKEKELLKEVHRLKARDKTIVTYNGSFDLLHAGHAKSLIEAKTLGDVLIVLLNSDKSVASYKSSKRPIVPQSERATMLASLEAVDYVCLFDEINPLRILNEIKPDIHANGADWGADCLERDVVEKNGGRIHILKWTGGLSTSNLVKKILASYKTPLVKAVFIDRDGTINHNGNGYIHKKEDIRFLPGVVSALKKLSKTDYKIIIVTNQSGIGRGYFTASDMEKVNKYLVRELKKRGARIDAVYHCPHKPDDPCSCRKPEVGMALASVKDFDISLNDSWIVGDSEADVMMGRRANMKTIKLGERMLSKIQPHYYVKNLAEAIGIILKNSQFPISNTQ
jgi:rfaE bifunctional protein nucleotidyltransferase chain/domain